MAKRTEGPYPVPEGWTGVHDNPNTKEGGLTYTYPNGDEYHISDAEVRKSVRATNEDE